MFSFPSSLDQAEKLPKATKSLHKNTISQETTQSFTSSAKASHASRVSLQLREKKEERREIRDKRWEKRSYLVYQQMPSAIDHNIVELLLWQSTSGQILGMMTSFAAVLRWQILILAITRFMTKMQITATSTKTVIFIGDKIASKASLKKYCLQEHLPWHLRFLRLW